jgi:hypothetical protein
MPYGKKSPTAMGHKSAMKMESAKQERKNLMDDNPVARTAAGNRPWIAKHYKSGMNYGSAMKMGHESPAKAAKPDFLDIDGDGDKKESMKKAAQDKKKK